MGVRGANGSSRPLGIADATVASYLDPTQVVAARRTVGGPAPREVWRRAGILREALATARATQAQRRGQLAAVEQRVQAAMREVA